MFRKEPGNELEAVKWKIEQHSWVEFIFPGYFLEQTTNPTLTLQTTKVLHEQSIW